MFLPTVVFPDLCIWKLAHSVDARGPLGWGVDARVRMAWGHVTYYTSSEKMFTETRPLTRYMYTLDLSTANIYIYQLLDPLEVYSRSYHEALSLSFRKQMIQRK